MKIQILSKAQEKSGVNRDGKEWASRTQDAKVCVGEYAYPLRLYLKTGEEYAPGDYRIAEDGWDYSAEKGLHAKKPFRLVKA